MEEESWASCGNRDYLTPWDLSSLSTKSSPMLSTMLGVEGEDGPSCNSWSPSLMFMNIIFNVSSPLLPQFPSTSSCTKSWSQSLLLIVVASFNFSLSHYCLIFTNFSFNFQNRTCMIHYSIAKCTNFPFQRVLIRKKLIPNKRLMSIYPSAAICPDEFQNMQRPMFLPYLLVWVFKFIDLGWVGTGISWSFWISTFSSLYVSVPVQNLMQTAGLALELWRCWRILISSLITNSWERFFMSAKYFKHTLPPGWRSGVETNANKSTIPKISICGKVSLAKLVSVRVC